MYPATLAEQLRARAHDVVSVHDPGYHHLEGVPDGEVFAAAIADDRALLTENVADFRRLETDALGRDAPSPRLIFTTNRQFPRGPGRNGGPPRPRARCRTRRAPRRVGVVFPGGWRVVVQASPNSGLLPGTGQRLRTQSACLSELTMGSGAGDGVRTRDIQLGKLTLCQLSYSRSGGRPRPLLVRARGYLKTSISLYAAYDQSDISPSW